MLAVQNTADEDISNIIYLNVPTGILFLYPPSTRHVTGCKHLTLILPPLGIDFMISGNLKLLKSLTANTEENFIVYVFFEQREAVYIGQSNVPRERFFKEIQVFFSNNFITRRLLFRSQNLAKKRKK